MVVYFPKREASKSDKTIDPEFEKLVKEQDKSKRLITRKYIEVLEDTLVQINKIKDSKLAADVAKSLIKIKIKALIKDIE